MEHIIQQIALEMARKILERPLLDGIFDLDTMSSLALEDCKEAARQVIQAFIEDANLAIRECRAERKERGLLIKEHDRPRDILTELGRIEYKRDYYFDRQNACYTSPIDLILGVNQYDRISKKVSAELVRAATDHSYQKSSAIVTDGHVSRQSVRNKILEVADLEVIPSGERRSAREIHVFADEDHVHMQREGKAKGKRSRQVPLVTVTEGVTGEYASRNRTINPMHFVDRNLDTTSLWENVDAYLRMQYDLDSTEKIYVHGDGANWIEAGLNDIRQTEHVMDGYHLGKYLRSINTKFPNRSVRYRIEKALKSDNKEEANRILESLKQVAEEPKQFEAIAEMETYLNNKWDSLVRRRVLDIPGSCTEGQVSHVLSERFSRNPMGWSLEALGKLSRLRVYVKNGGKIKGKHFEKARAKAEEANATCYEELIKREVSGCFDWSMFDGEPPIFNGSTGTQSLIQMLGKTQNWLLS